MNLQRRASDFCPACDKPWDECQCPRLYRMLGGVLTAEPDPWYVPPEVRR